MTGSLAALRNAFAGQNVSTEVRIGETGWPTRGAQPAQPNAFLASAQQAQWYAQAMQNWSASNGVRTILFEAYDEPWKGSPDNSNSEGCFGIWQVEGTSSAQNQYTLTGETLKYPLSAAQVAW